MLIRHIAALVLALPLVAQAPLPIGTPRPVTPRAPAIAAGVQEDAKIASSGRETIVAWSDRTEGRAGVYVARLGDDGTVLPAKQRRLSEHATSLAIAWTGSAYAVVWVDTRTFTTHAMTIDSELQTIGASRVILEQGGVLSNFVWSGNRGALVGGRTLLILDGSLDVVAKADDVVAGIFDVQHIRLAASPDVFAVFAELDREERIFLARRYSRDGAALETAPVEVATVRNSGGHDWDVVFGGNRYALVFAEDDDTRLVMRRALIDPQTLAVRELATKSIGVSSGPRVEWAGDRFIASWLEITSDLYRLGMLPFTDSADSPVVHTAATAGRAARADDVWTGTELIVAYELLTRDTNRDIAATVTDWRDGTAATGVVSMSPQWQSLSATASAGSSSVVAWAENHPLTDVMRIAFARVDKGTPATPVYLSQSAMPYRPAVVWTGATYLIFWTERGESGIDTTILMRRVSREGVVLGESATPITAGGEVSAAWNGKHVAIVSNRLGVSFVLRLLPDGTPVDTTPLPVRAHRPLIASNGTDFMLVWTEGTQSEFPQQLETDIYAARITAAGTVEAPFAVATGATIQGNPAIASDGRDYVVVYSDTDDQGEISVSTKKILREGALAGTTAGGPGQVLAILENYVVNTAIAAAANGYFVAWEEQAPTSYTELRLATTDRDGMLTGGPQLVEWGEVPGMTPSILATNRNAALLFHSAIEDDTAYGPSMRLLMREIGTASSRRRSARH